jgi:SAM-dependent methyltransferase
MAGLRRVRRTWERWGRTDPLYGVLSTPETRHGGWDHEPFFASGREHIDLLVTELTERGLLVTGGRALDFGCGVGRLTQALTAHFDDVHGVDISEAMVAEARALATADRRPTFHHNPQGDLALFADGTFDLVVTFLVLQHMPADDALGYVAEFVRVLSPHGIAVFQAPEAHLPPTRLLDGRRLSPRWRNRVVRARASLLRRPYMEMHMVSPDQVRATVAAAGGEVVEAEPDWSGGDFCRSIRYLVRRADDRGAGATGS